MTGLREWWERYWFAPGPTLDLAVVRWFGVGSHLFFLLFPYALMDFSPFRDFHVQTGYPAEDYRPPPLLALLHPWGRPTYDLLVGVLVVTTAAGFTALIGWFTRTSCLILALGSSIMICHHYSYYENHHVEAITVILLFVLAASPCGRRLSVDAAWRRWRGRRETSPSRPRREVWAEERDELATWPIRLLQWVFSLAYFSAAYCKLGASGLEWLNGYTMQAYLLQDGLYWNKPLGIWLGQQHQVCWLSSWFSIVVEGGFFLVLVFPRLRWLFVPGAALLHLGIFFTMGAPFLQYIPLYAVFVPWSRLLQRTLERPLPILSNTSIPGS